MTFIVPVSVLCVLSACIIVAAGTDLDPVLLRENHDGPTSEGTDFAIAFMNNVPNAAADSRAFLYVLNKSPNETAIVDVTLPRNPSYPGYPRRGVRIGPNSREVFQFTSTGSNDIRVTLDAPLDQNKGIRVTSTNNIPVAVIGSNSETKSTDAFLALPCQVATTTREYKYFIFTSDAGDTSTHVSQFVIVACEDATRIEYRSRDGSRVLNPTVIASSQTYGVSSTVDITGLIVRSNKPIAVFSGHQCGRIPADESACDHLVEQIPMHAVWGNTFFTAPFGYRGAGEFYRIGTVLPDNEISITCSSRSGSGAATYSTTKVTLAAAGDYHQLRTDSNPSGTPLTNYRRQFCCIETSMPAIVMQYMPGHSVDEVTVLSIGNGIGDPSIAIIPPVEQYRSKFIGTNIMSVETFTNLATWTVPALFFDPATNMNEILLNNNPITPGALQGGSAGYIAIQCSNGEVCGYGAFNPIPNTGTYLLDFNSTKDNYPGINFNLYGYVAEMSYAYSAGFEMELIGLPRISIYNLTVLESAGSVSMPFNRTGGDLSDITRIDARTRSVAGQAVAGTDYTSVGPERIRWQRNAVDPNSNDVPFEIPILDDDIAEPNEYFEVTFNVVLNGYPFPGVARVTIIDDDRVSLPEVMFDPTSYTVIEGNTATVMLTLSLSSTSAVMVTVSSSDGSATAGTDYEAITQSVVTFAPNTMTTTLAVRTLDDNINELSETFELTLQPNPSGATLGTDDKATVTITDNDDLIVQFVPDSYTIVEGENATFMLMLNRAADRPVTVTFNTMDGTATSPGDYSAVSMVVTFPAGETKQTVTVLTQTDNVTDSNETFSATLSNPTNGLQIGPARNGTVTILDAAVVSFDPTMYAVTEGPSAVATVGVVLSRASTETVTVNLATADGTAVASSDYTGTTTTVTFSPGSTRETVSLPIIDDSINELTESFTAQLSSPTGAQLGDSTATITIDDDDDLEFSITPATLSIPEGGTNDLTVQTSVPADRVVSVTVTSGGGTATPSVDYTPISTVVTFQPGDTTATVPVLTTQDELDEPDETFEVALSNPTGGGTLGTPSSSTVTIDDDDDPISVQFEPAVYTADEGTSAGLMVVLSRDPVQDVVVTVTTASGTAVEGVDYTGIATFLTFPEGGSRTMTVSVPISTDGLNDPGEFFTATLSNPTGAVLGTATMATVNINDANPVNVQFVPATYSVNEGMSVNVVAMLNVQSTQDLTVDFDTMPGTAAASDYTAVRRTLTFPASTVRMEVTIATTDDDVAEADETFSALLSNPGSGLAVGTQDTATITILDDDTPSVKFNPSDYTVTEGQSGSLMVVLSNPSDSEVTVELMTADGTATEPDDYTAVSTVVVFAPGEISTTVPVAVLDDNINERPENFTATLSNPSGATLGTPTQATITIIENDDLVVNFNPTSYMPVEGGTAMLTATLNSPADRDVTVQVRLVDGTATAPQDYINGVRTLTFSAGSTTASTPVSIVDDDIQEGVERFTAELFNPQNGLTVGPSNTATIDITDNDVVMVMFNPSVYTVNEGESVTATVQLSLLSTEEVTVDVTSSSGTATDGTDYTSVSQTLTFAPNEMSTTFPVSALTDGVDEVQEQFTLTLSNPSSNAQVGAPSMATVFINDTNRLLVDFVPTDYTVTEGGAVTLTTMLNIPADRAVTVEFSTMSGTATSDDDFTSEETEITFLRGDTTATVTIMTTDDDVQEGTEQFTAVLTNPTNGLEVGPDGTATVDISDNDVVNVQFQPDSYTVSEASGEAMLNVVLTKPSASQVFVDIQTSQGTAQDNTDFTPVSMRLTFAPSATSQVVPVPIINDNTNEGVETFTAVLSNPQGAGLGTARTAIVEITDDDPLTIQFNPTQYTGNEGENVPLTAVLNRPADREITVTIQTEDGTAVAPNDYTSTSVVLTFPAGAQSATTFVPIADDGINERQESFTATLSSPSGGATLGPNSTATVTIPNPQPLTVNFSPNTYTVDEGESTDLMLMLNSPADRDVSVEVFLSPDTATVNDYVVEEYTVTFAAGETKQSITVMTREDDLSEGPEDFTAMIRNPMGEGLSVGDMGTATVIIDDDDTLSVNFNPTVYTVSEGESAAINVVLSNPSASQVVVDVVSVGGTATENSDYVPVNEQVTFAPGQVSRTVNVTTVEDTMDEVDEVFSVVLRNPNGAALGPSSRAEVTINDDDMVVVQFDQPSYSVTEGNDAEITVVADRVPAIDVSVTFTTSDGSASSPDDYTGGVVTVTIPSGQTSATVTVPTRDDNIGEQTENFMVTLSNPSSDAVLGTIDQAVVEIEDNNPVTVNFVSDDYTVPESDGSVMVCIVLSNPADEDVLITGETLALTPPQAQDQIDFVHSTLSFNITAGSTSACDDVTIIDDDIVEETEKFQVMLNPIPSSIIMLGDRSKANITIIDDDSFTADMEQPVYRVRENDTSVEVCATLSNPSSQPITVMASTKPITQAQALSQAQAMAGEDYVSDTIMFMFAPGETRACSRVRIVDNDIVEPPEEGFLIEIDPPTTPDGPAPGPRSTSTIIIEDDDDLVVNFEQDGYTVRENEGPVQVCVELNLPATEEVQVFLIPRMLEFLNAQEETDFLGLSVPVTFEPGQTHACGNITIVNDNIRENSTETFIVDIVVPSDQLIIPMTGPRSSVPVDVVDDDVVRISWETPTVVVPETIGITMACFNTSIGSVNGYTVTVTSEGSTSNLAMFGVDYRTPSQNIQVSIPPGPAGRYCVPVMIIDDGVAMESNETFVLQFENLPPRVRPGSVPETSVVIVDNDVVAVDFQTPDMTVNEADGDVMVCVIRNATTPTDMTVTIVTNLGSAGISDLVPVTQDVVFRPMEIVSCIDIPILNDLTPESRESFTLGFLPQSGVVAPAPGNVANVTIIDDDVPTSSSCIIRDALRVSPFNSSSSIQFRGGCELTAVAPCSGVPDFSVRVDYLTDTLDIGAVGIVRDGVVWSIREDQTIETTSEEVPVISGNTTTYVASGVTIIDGNNVITLNVVDLGVSVVRTFAEENTVEITGGSLTTCGICGTQQGLLRSLDGTITPINAPMEARQAFVSGYRVPARDQRLRPVRAECAVVRNDSIIGDPLYTVPFGTDNLNLCYEIHGRANTIFNLISDTCVNVNARYAGVPGGLNIIDSVAVRAQGDSTSCRDIRVDLENCSAYASPRGGGLLIPLSGMLEEDGISVRLYPNRVRIAVPNCRSLRLVMWATCAPATPDSPSTIQFHVSRGINLSPTSHGLLGQFWNIPITATQISSGANYNVTVQPVNGDPRSFQGEYYGRTWENKREPCIYVGNAQGGRSGENPMLDDSVIQGNYKTYIMDDLFDTDFDYEEWDGVCSPIILE